MEIRDKVAIVTGAARGIGRATAVAIARAGARAVVLAESDLIGVSELPDHIGPDTTSIASHAAAEAHDLRGSLRNHEVRLIRDALSKSGGNQRKAAELLQVPLRTFQRRLSQLGLGR